MKFLILIAAMLMLNIAQAQNKTLTLSKANTLIMDKEFSPESVAAIALKARAMDAKLPAGVPIVLVINSPGGDIFAGLELIENLNSLGRRIDTLSIFAASMGFHTSQHLNGNRFIPSNGTLMSHKARGGFSGEFPGQLDSRYSYILGVVTDMDKVVASRSKVHSLKSYQALMENEYWCSPSNCKKNGFIDAEVNVKCDKTLAGTHEEIVEVTLFIFTTKFVVIKSDCPTTTAPLSVKVLPKGGESEDSFIRRLTRDQQILIEKAKVKIIEEYTTKTKRVAYYKAK